MHEFFNELRDPNTHLDNEPLPDLLFNFTDEEISLAPEIIPNLIPAHVTITKTAPTSSSTTTDSEMEGGAI